MSIHFFVTNMISRPNPSGGVVYAQFKLNFWPAPTIGQGIYFTPIIISTAS